MRRPALFLAFTVALASVVGLFAPAAGAATAPPAPKSSIAVPFVDQSFTLTGSIGTTRRAVQLEHYAKSWKVEAKATSATDGSYAFTTRTSASSRRYRVVAPKTALSPAVTSGVLTVRTKRDAVRLVLTRNRTTGLALGTAAVPAKGRTWTLQVRRGSSWKPVGTAVTEGAKGAIRASFPLGSHSYRLVGAPVPGSKGATSSTEKIAAGPKTFGRHVLFVSTDSGTFPTVKGRDYAGAAMIDNGGLLQLEDFAVRGNSSARYPKKPYKIKFSDPQTPLGLPKGKTFDLLSNFQDHSLIRTAVGIGAVPSQLEHLAWTPHRAFTELFVNGQYRGSYELIESIKIQNTSKKNAARLAIDEDTGVIIEINPSSHRGVPGLFKGHHKMYYGMKDPDEVKYEADGKTVDPEGVTAAKKAGMKTKIEKFEKVLYSSGYKNPKTGWTKYLDMDSAVDFYLEKEFIKDWDGDFYASTFFYTDDYSDPAAKFFMGPIWDVDRSAGGKTGHLASIQSPKGWWMNGDGGGGHVEAPSHNVHDSHWFVRIAKDPAFQRALKARWALKHGVFKAAGDTGVDAAVKELTKTAAANDRKLWQGSQPHGRYLPKAKTYNGEVAFAKHWYQARYSWMNSKLK